MKTGGRLVGIALCAMAFVLGSRAELHAQAGPAFTCDGSIYQVQSGQLRIFDPVTSSYTNVGPQNGSYNATGYNVVDNYAYASQGGNIIRISANGVIENVFNIGFGSFSGDLDYANNYYLRRNNNRYARIDLSTGTVVDVDFAGPGGGPADVAYIQSGGSEYLIGFAGSGGGTLYRYNITTQTKTNVSLPGLPSGGFGAAWTDSTGRMFTFNNGNGRLYEVFDYLGGSPSFRLVGNGDPSGNNDGFSCSLAAFPNLAPLAFDDDYTAPINTAVTSNVLPDNGNGADNDPEGFPLTVTTTPVSGPSNGTVALAADGSFTYTPDTNFVGVDSFDYVITDTSGLTATATVTITITGTIDFTITKTQVSGPDPATTEGEVIGYEIVLTNIGDIPLTGVSITDTLPDGSTAALGGPVESGGTGSVLPGRLDVSETWTYTTSYVVTQDDLDAGVPLVNSVRATTTETGATPRDTTETTGVTSTPSFTISKTALPTSLSAPGTIAYEITVDNTGTVSLTNAAFTDVLEQDGTTLTLTTGPTRTGDTDGDDALDPDETWVYTASFAVTQAQIDQGADLVNTATFAPDEAPPASSVAATSITQAPSLSVSKTSDTANLTAPGLITYDITVANTGNVTLTSVSLTDTVTQGATTPALASGPLLVGGDVNSNAALDVGETWTYQATFEATQDQIDNGNDIVNAVSVTSDEGTTGGSTTSTTITGTPSYTIAKTVDRATLSAPGTLTYAITVENTGNVSLTGVSLADDLTQGASTLALTSGPTLSGDADGDGEVDPGELWRYAASFAVTQGEIDDGGDIVNTATFLTNELPDQSAAATTTLTQTSSIALGKAVASGEPTSFSAVGDTIDFTFTVENTGNVTLSGPITVDDDQIGTGLVCQAGDLAPGVTITCDFTWTATQADLDAGSVTNTATASGGPGITSPPQTATVTASQDPALSIAKTIVAPIPATYSDGEVLNYEYLVTNAGNVTLTEPITVTDNLTTVSCPAIPPAGLVPTASITCTASYTITTNDLALGSTTNVAFAETTFDGAPVVSPTDDAIFPVSATPVLDLVKAATPLTTPITAVGDEIEYSYTITNVPPTSGTGAALSEVIFIDDDKFPAPFVCYDPAVDGGSFGVGDTHVCTATYTVTQADLDAGEVVNEAVAETVFAPASPSPISVTSRADTVTVPISATPGLTLAKSVSAGPSPAAVGDTLSYTIVATNSGNQTLTNVSISDPLVPSLICDGAAPVSLAPGAALTCTGTYVVVQEDIDGQTVGSAGPVLSNIATVSANDPGGSAIPTVDATNDHPLEGASPAVTILKELFPDPSADPAFTDVGDTLQYRMTVTNSGNMTLSSVDVTDSLVPGTCTTGSLAPGEVDQSCFFTYAVTQADIDAGEVLNTATATAQPADPGATPVVGTDDLTSPGPDAAGALTVLKGGTLDLGGDGIATPGDIVTYTITVTNTGNVTLADIAVTDPSVDTGSLTYAPADDGDSDGDIDSLAPNASATVAATYTLTQDDVNTGSVSNSASVTGQDPSGADVTDVSDSTNPGDGAGADDPTVTQIPRGPAMTIVKTPSVASGVVVGQVITYSYLVTNTGNVTLTDITLDDQHTSASGTSALAISDGGVIASLAPGDSATLTGDYTVTQADIDAGVPLTNTVSGTATAPDGATGPTASDDASVDPVAQAGALEVIKTVTGVSGSRAGDTISFEITVENVGNVSISDVVLTDDLTRLDSTPVTPDPVPTFTGGDTGAQAGVLDVGETWTYSVVHTLTQADIDAGGVSNSATATGEDPAGTPVTDTSDDDGVGIDAPTAAPIPPDPTLDVTKTAGTPSRVSGDTFSVPFSIRFENTGNITQNNVSALDDLSGFLGAATLVTATITEFDGPATVAANTGYNGLADPELLATGAVMAVGDVVTLEIEVIYDGSTGAPAGTNTVAITSDERTTPATASATAVTDIASASINATKSATPSNPARGDLVTYALLFENNLSTIETDVTLVDALPEGLVYQEGTALFNGGATPAPTRSGNQLRWGPIDIAPGEIVALQFQARVLGGGGQYVNRAYALDSTGAQISATGTATIEVRAEPVFDCSDVIGKVFDDVDGNGSQTRTERGAALIEPGLPGVKVVTTRGTIITTDAHGRFSVPCAELPDRIGSNFTLKLDTRSLPTGYRVTTENPRVIRLTPGKMARINFGARIGNIVDIDLMASAFIVADGQTTLRPELERALIKALTHIRSERTALRLSYLRERETYERALKRLDLVEEFIRDAWRDIGRYRLSIERVVVVPR